MKQHYGKTELVVCKDARELGRCAADAVAQTLRRLLAEQDRVRAVFAAGESQTTFLEALAAETGIAWDRTICFNIDDFHDVRMPERFTCGHQTRTLLYDRVHPGQIHLVQFNAPDPEAEARRFESVLRDAGPIDLVSQGIGTSGHLALNEPFDTRFDDPACVRVVRVAEQSKRQLRDDPNFRELGYIPEHGITMTIPAILSARHLFTIVPLALKRPILTRLFEQEAPTTDLPASILRTVPGMLFVDRDSTPALPESSG